VVQANGLGIAPVVLADSGNIDSAGGAKNASLLTVLASGLVSGETAHAVAIGRGSYSRSESALANLTIAVAGNTIRTGFLLARANAYCGVGPTGNTEIDGLVVNGLAIAVTGAPNQTVPLAGGASMILNEQTTSFQNGSITVNAIHVTVPGVTDVVIGSAFAAISGQLVGTSRGSRRIVALLLQGAQGPCPNGFPCQCPDRVTGGGWIVTTGNPDTTNGAKGTFGVAGGFHNGAPWGHLEYIDHNTGLKVHGLNVTNCFAIDAFTREITGMATCNDQGSFFYRVKVQDNGEPGTTDTFGISVPDCAYAAGPHTLDGGNIQLHP